MPFASYVMQAACFFTTGFFVFGPQMLIGMAAAECSHKEAAGAATGLLAVCLSGGIALRLAAGEGDGGLALDRVFRGDRHCGGDFRAAAAAVFKRPGSARSQRSVMHLTFALSGAKLRNFPGFTWTLSHVSRLIFTMPAIRRYKN
jgi:OPA family sugar phosphate sensor protein UhpC-like MFS transporter